MRRYAGMTLDMIEAAVFVSPKVYRSLIARVRELEGLLKSCRLKLRETNSGCDCRVCSIVRGLIARIDAALADGGTP